MAHSKATGISLTNLEIARLLRKIAAAYTISGENRFKVIAYDNAATAVEHATSEVKDLFEENKLDTIPGLGPSIQSHLSELFKTGYSKHFDQVLSKVNPAIFPLLEVPGLGPKKAQKLVEMLNIKSEQEVFTRLEQAARQHKIAEIPTFGEESEKNIIEGIERYKKGSIKEKRMVLPQADKIAEELIDYLKESCGSKIKRIDKLGSLRRQVATIGDIDLAVATDHSEEVLDSFVAFPKKVNLIERGPTGASLLLASGRQCDLRVGQIKTYGAMLQYFTGSKYHNIRLRDFALRQGFSLNEYGITPLKKGSEKKSFGDKEKTTCHFPDEASFYGFLKLDYIPPEIREDSGEIEAAKSHSLPQLIELKDVKGDLQMHSDYDQETSHDSGLSSMQELRDFASRLNYEFIGISDHNPSTSKHSAVQIVTKLEKQRKHVEQINMSSKSTQIINMLEVDILPSGDLSVPNGGLNTLDACLVSIHSVFTMNKSDMTKRVIKGLSHPCAKILAHPTGRLLEEREGYELDWDQIFEFCLAQDKALEINCYPNRLDLPDVLVHEAVKRGVKLSLGTDSHIKDDLINMRYGVSVARRGWAEKKNIINTWDYQKLITWMHKRG